MLNLFSPLTLGRTRLSNRIVLAAVPSGYAAPGGFADEALAAYYSARAQGGVGMLVFEHTGPLTPLLDWLSREDVIELRMEPLGLHSIYHRYHGTEL